MSQNVEKAIMTKIEKIFLDEKNASKFQRSDELL